MLRDTNSLAIVAQFAEDMGMPRASLLKGVPDTVLGGSVQVEDEVELRVLSNMLNWWLLHGPLDRNSVEGRSSQWSAQLALYLGWQLGRRYQLTSYGIWGYALLASASQREAIQLGLKYLGLTYTFCNIDFQDGNGRPYLSLRPIERISGLLASVVLARDLTALTVINGELFQGPPPKGVISLPAWLLGDSEATSDGVEMLPSDVKQFFAEQAGAVLTLAEEGQAEARVYLDAGWLDQPLPRANRSTAALCEDQCRQLLESKRNLSGLSGLVREQILAQGLGVSMAAVVQNLGMTERTLHRKLKAEGSSWRQVRDAVRFGMAEELLQTQMSIEEIAGRLGFSDSANFTHGFKRWSGLTPGKYRTQSKRNPVLSE